MSAPRGEERLIVALDVPAQDDALRLVEDLDGVVSFFKVGLELFMGGAMWDLVERLARERRVFVDLKIPDDIGETIRRAVALPAGLGVRFLTFSAHLPATIAAAVAARAGREHPKLLGVPLLSSLDGADLRGIFGEGAPDVDAYVERRARTMVGAGCDGLIASGGSIGKLRSLFPRDVILVSPGIRPGGSAADDHKRLATPSEAVAMGADYLVVGRPIRNAPDRAARRRVASGIIEEMDAAFERRSAAPGAGGGAKHAP
jgi:orotidine-5'-phosphate decarboxylase